MDIIYDVDTDTLQDAQTARYVRERGMYVPDWIEPPDVTPDVASLFPNNGAPTIARTVKRYTHARDGAGITLR